MWGAEEEEIFVMSAIINSIKNGSQETRDITIYNIEKCFDALWVQECLNTLNENGLDDEKLVLLHQETKNAKIAIKTATGITERVDIQNTIMHGTVCGSPICKAVVDKLTKIFYGDKNLLCMYKGKVEVPILGMVDDVVNVDKCSNKTVTSIATINAFMEANKLTLPHNKCSKIHIGKRCNNCPKLNVHDEQMKESQAETYLGDVINEDGKLDATI